MASLAPIQPIRRMPFVALTRADRAIGGPLFDFLFFWGAPMLALAILLVLGAIAAALPVARAATMTATLSALFAVVTYSHLIAVVPRAYLNSDVFAQHRTRLVVAPILVIAALASSSAALIAGMVLAVFWDVHHSAMQNFGIGRIYDAKAGNDPHTLRRTDLWLAYALYIGPAAAGASMIVHFNSFARFDAVGWDVLTAVPGRVEGWAGAIRIGAVIAWLVIVGGALRAYARAGRRGYNLPAHKLALLISTGVVSVLAWDFTPPFIALATVNLLHAVQYFAIVWLKEGKRIGALTPGRVSTKLPLFLIACAGFGLLYWWVAALGPLKAGAWLAPFVACSLLHFWYDAFIWSVRKRQV